ncbi:MAG: ATP-binding cassette domain-containing protein [bacterium]
MTSALRIDNLWKSYSAGVRGCSVRVWVLRGCSLQVDLGERVAIVGSRGSGKSTLLQCIAGVRRGDAGRIDVSLPIRACFAAPYERAESVGRMTAATLLLVEAADVTALQRDWCGASIIASRDVASVHHLVDRVMLLRDGRLSPLTRIAVRRVAERTLSVPGGAVIR